MMARADETLSSIAIAMHSLDKPTAPVTIWLGPADNRRIIAATMARSASGFEVFGLGFRVCEGLEPGEIYSVPLHGSIARVLREVHEDWIRVAILRMFAEAAKAKDE